jgi:hypothetical protein
VEVHPLKPLLIVPVRMPSTLPSNQLDAPNDDVIDCQNGRRAEIFGSAPASPGKLPENIHVFMSYFQDRRAVVVKV